jgi:DNA-binding MarR family transcriptional regulator
MPARAESDLLIPGEVVRHFERAERGLYDARAARAFFLVKALAQRMNDVASTWLQPFGLTPSTFNVLSFLRAAPKRSMSLSSISRSLHTRPATVTSLIDGLERDGLIVRRAHVTDRRTTMATLTAAGARLIDRAAREHHRHVNAVLSEVRTPERDALIDTLLRIADGLAREKPQRQRAPATRAEAHRPVTASRVPARR